MRHFGVEMVAWHLFVPALETRKGLKWRKGRVDHGFFFLGAYSLHEYVRVPGTHVLRSTNFFFKTYTPRSILLKVEKRQLWVRPIEWLKLNFASCVVHQTRSHSKYQVWFSWTKRTIWLLILSFTQNIVRPCSMFYPYEGYRQVGDSPGCCQGQQDDFP